VEELFVLSGSLVVDDTVAVLQTLYGTPFTVAQTVPPDPLNVEAFTLMVISTTVPTFIVPIVQLTVPLLCVHVPCVVETLVNVTSVGSGSETVTPLATAGPLLVTCSVYVKFVFWSTGSGVAVFTIATSACVGEATTVEEEAVLFAVFGSVAVGPMVAVLVITVPGVSADVICSTSGNVAIAPTASGPVQVTTPSDGAKHDHPLGAAKDTNVAFTGSVSV
jgi:hypothetical protein